MAPGPRNKFGPPIFELEVFRKQTYCFEKCLWHCCDFLVPHSDSAPVKLCPLTPWLRFWCYAIKIGNFSKNKKIQVRWSWTSIPWTSAIFEQNTQWILLRLPAKVTGSVSGFFVQIFSAWTCACFASNKPFPHQKVYFFKVRWIWQKFLNSFEGRFCSRTVW